MADHRHARLAVLALVLQITSSFPLEAIPTQFNILLPRLTLHCFILRKAISALDESRGELAENLRWIKAVIVHPDTSLRVFQRCTRRNQLGPILAKYTSTPNSKTEPRFDRSFGDGYSTRIQRKMGFTCQCREA